MKMRMVASIAGAIAAGIVHHALVNGLMTHPRPLHVGLNSLGTTSLGVATPVNVSNEVIEQIVRKIPKSLMATRTCQSKPLWLVLVLRLMLSLLTRLGKKLVVLKFLSTTQRK